MGRIRRKAPDSWRQSYGTVWWRSRAVCCLSALSLTPAGYPLFLSSRHDWKVYVSENAQLTIFHVAYGWFLPGLCHSPQRIGAHCYHRNLISKLLPCTSACLVWCVKTRPVLANFFLYFSEILFYCLSFFMSTVPSQVSHFLPKVHC